MEKYKINLKESLLGLSSVLISAELAIEKFNCFFG